jgi:hypothetical protein
MLKNAQAFSVRVHPFVGTVLVCFHSGKTNLLFSDYYECIRHPFSIFLEKAGERLDFG